MVELVIVKIQRESSPEHELSEVMIILSSREDHKIAVYNNARPVGS